MTQSTETIRDEWLTLADRNLDNELKSSVFTSLLSKYVNLLVDMSTTKA